MHYRAPADGLAPELLEELREQKQAIINFLDKSKAPTRGQRSLQRISRETDLPLSFAQERLWFLGELDLGSAVYNIPMVLWLDGALDVAALRSGLEELVRRHEALRTRFETVVGRPVQVIEPICSLEMPFVDLSELPEVERDAEATRLCREEARRPFDLGRDLMLRAKLFRLDVGRHALFLNLHHIAADGWSLEVLLRELGSLYEAFCKGQASPLEDLPIQYADFSAWQRDWLQGEVLEKQLGYWKTQLGGAPALLELPTDRSRPARQSYRGGREATVFPNSLLGSVKALSRQEGASLFMTLLAAFHVLLSRYSGQEDITVGSPIAGRNRIELEGLIGLFVNTLVLRGDLSGNPTVRELLQRMKEVTLGAYAHQDLPFEKLVEKLQPERNLSYHPLFQVMFTLENTSAVPGQLDGLGLNLEWVPSGTSKFDLSMSMSEVADGLKAEVEYCTDLFDAATIRRMLGHYQVLLEGIVANPDAHIDQLPLLTQAERHQLLVEWNQTDVDYPRDKCIHQLFEEQVERTPDAVAVVFEDQQLTYRELNERSNQLAHRLRKLGIGPDVLVGLCIERSLEMLVGLLGILKAGGAYVPLDPSYPKERIQFVLEDAQVDVLLTQSSLQGDFRSGVSAYKVIPVDTPLDKISKTSTENLESGVGSRNLSYVIYTSGSTGKPKGVAIEHRSAVSLVYWAHRVYSSDECAGVLFSTSICFDLSIFEMFVPLSCGGKVILAQNLLQLITMPAASEVTLLNTVPSAIRELIKRQAVPPSVCTVNLAGELLEAELVKQIYKIPNVKKVYDLYGPTETTTYSSWALRRTDGPRTIGRPVGNTQIYLLDGNELPVPVGVPGQIYIGGAGLARGYWNRPELTEQKFVADPIKSELGDRLFKTGDLARYLPDGNIEFKGRIDRQVKIRGYRIELGEIEAVLKLHPLVTKAVVLAREDVPGERRLVAYVTPATSAQRVSELRQFLKEKLPAFMLPSTFVFTDAFPHTANGKLDFKAFPAPESAAQAHASKPAEALTTPAECRVAEIWRKILRLERVGLQENFFDLGGHSLLLLQLHAELEREFSRHFALVELFQRTTVAAQAEWLTSETGSDNTLLPIRHAAVVQLRAGTGKLPVYFIFAGPNEISLAQMMGDGHSIFGIEVPWRMSWREAATNNKASPTMEQLIAPFVSILRAHVGSTPCVLAGYSFAGLMAFEAAHQLRRLGVNVELVILLDTRLKDPSPFSRAWYNFPRTWFNFRQQWEELDIRSRAEQSVLSMGARLQNAWHVFWGMCSYRITRVFNRPSLKSDFVTWRVDEKGVPLLWSLIERLHNKVEESYMPRRLECRGILFRSNQGLEQYSYRGDETRGWKNLFTKGLETVIVTGDHWTMFRDDLYRVALAARVTEVLDRYSSKDEAPAETSS